MSRYPAERHNEEFIRLYKSFGMTKLQISEALGVSYDTVRQWTKPLTIKSAIACPKHRVDAFKIVLGKKLANLSDSRRERVMEILRASGR
jgi:transposase